MQRRCGTNVSKNHRDRVKSDGTNSAIESTPSRRVEHLRASKDFRFGQLGPQHPYGLCICCDELRVIFVHIPKNGSSSFRTFFSSRHRGREVNYFDLPENTRKSYYTFCVLRDVKDRFHSAINTIISRGHTDISSLSTETLRRMVDDMIDAHIVRQIEFVSGLRIDYFCPFVKLCDIPVHKNAAKSGVVEDPQIQCITDRVIKSVYREDIELLQRHRYDSSHHNKFLRRLRLK